LAGGDGQPAYVLYPANAFGIEEKRLSLSDYPLGLASLPELASLWVLAWHPQASLPLDMADLARRLALSLDSASLPLALSPLADGLADQPDLWAWFGALEIQGEAVTLLPTGETWQAEEARFLSADGGLAVSYRLDLADPAPSPTPSSLAQTEASKTFEGYRLVVDEDFAGATSRVEWFIGSDSTYASSYVDGAYQIYLKTIDPRRNVGLSWGSIQGLYFQDYIVRARFRVLEENIVARLGLWLHYQDDFNFLFFGLENTGRYRVARFQRVYTELQPWTSDAAILTGTAANTLEIKSDNNIFTLAINGRPVVTTADEAFEEGRIAFFCYAETVPATCHLESLQVWVPQNSPFPLPTNTPRP
jgi:hypothetical protein